MIKVYATVSVQNNLITTIPFKGMKVRVEFTGGNSMKGIPAKLYTRDPFTMKALDSSDQLGRLYSVYQVISEEGDDKGREERREPDGEPSGTTANERSCQGASETEPKTAASETKPKTAAKAESPLMEGERDGVTGSSEKLEFENLAEAVTYIATKYGEQVENENQVRKFLDEKEGKKCTIHKG